MARRSLAASVVVTISLAELACTSSGGEQTRNPPFNVNDGKQPEPEDEEALIGRNPPDPGLGSADAGGETPPPPPKVTIERYDDGTCAEVVTVTCPEGAECNPPPPRDVPCPPDESGLPQAGVLANVARRDDGKCWESFQMDCPEGSKCNPPPPRQVQCPPELEPKGAKAE